MWELLLIRLCFLITISLGTILIALYVTIQKINKFVGLLCLTVGCLVIVMLILWLISFPGTAELLRIYNFSK